MHVYDLQNQGTMACIRGEKKEKSKKQSTTGLDSGDLTPFRACNRSVHTTVRHTWPCIMRKYGVLGYEQTGSVCG